MWRADVATVYGAAASDTIFEDPYMPVAPTTDRPAADRAHWPKDHPKVATGRIGVLLLNLGTPDGTGYWPMRRYLKEFLSDARVIEEPRWKWWPILNLIILTVRPGRKGKDYAKIWNNERDEGPLKTITRAQAEQLRRRARAIRASSWIGRCAMPIPRPRSASRAAGAGLRPHPVGAALSAVCRRDDGDGRDHAFRALMKMRWQPAVRVAPAYHDDPVYIGSLAASMRATLSKLDFEPERIIATFHGMPQKYLEAGDPYHCHCQKTSRLLREKAWHSPRKNG